MLVLQSRNLPVHVVAYCAMSASQDRLHTRSDREVFVVAKANSKVFEIDRATSHLSRRASLSRSRERNSHVDTADWPDWGLPTLRRWVAPSAIQSDRSPWRRMVWRWERFSDFVRARQTRCLASPSPRIPSVEEEGETLNAGRTFWQLFRQKSMTRK